MKQLINTYQDPSFVPVDETTFIDFDRYDQTLKLNDIQILASHNSYKKRAVPLGRLFVGLANSFDEARALNYGYKSITDQLKLGIRSMEFDLRLRKDQFMLTHVPLVDNSSVAPLFNEALEEIQLFSINHPNHIPIIILIEIKDDYMFLDHALQKIDQPQLEKLDALIKLKLGNQLFRPKDMIKENQTLRETVMSSGWPLLHTVLGKVLFVLHPGSSTSKYYELDPSLDSLSMFIGGYSSDIALDYASFIIHNEPNVSEIETLVNQNFMVRTRIDADLEFNLEDYEKALLSGAQILSSDFTIARSDLKSQLVIYLPNQKMIIKRN